jgi:TrpR-related protein YerC/YecD
MIDRSTTIWQSNQTQQLVAALLAIENSKVMQNFLRDVMTEKEIIEVSARLEAAKMLQKGAKYTNIVAKTKLSSRTVARISDWMKNGSGGYKTVLSQINEHHHHLPPARAE